MTLEQASARNQHSDHYDPTDVVFYNGYYYVCASEILVVCHQSRPPFPFYHSSISMSFEK
jgi:hypothetical protein